MTAKACSNCAHRAGPTVAGGKCSVFGGHITTRDNPCGPTRTGWAPRAGLVQRFAAIFVGWRASDVEPQTKPTTEP